MTTPDITIPPEALEAAAKAIEKSMLTARLQPADVHPYTPEARAACIAMLTAWPGMEKTAPFSVWHGECIFLPLPKKETT